MAVSARKPARTRTTRTTRKLSKGVKKPVAKVTKASTNGSSRPRKLIDWRLVYNKRSRIWSIKGPLANTLKPGTSKVVVTDGARRLAQQLVAKQNLAIRFRMTNIDGTVVTESVYPKFHKL